jgi:hypothetical protein
MKTVEKWKWRVHWAGRMVVTRVPFTADEIKARHPDAIRMDGTRLVVELPETQAELDAARQPRGSR